MSRVHNKAWTCTSSNANYKKKCLSIFHLHHTYCNMLWQQWMLARDSFFHVSHCSTVGRDGLWVITINSYDVYWQCWDALQETERGHRDRVKMCQPPWVTLWAFSTMLLIEKKWRILEIIRKYTQTPWNCQCEQHPFIPRGRLSNMEHFSPLNTATVKMQQRAWRSGQNTYTHIRVCVRSTSGPESNMTTTFDYFHLWRICLSLLSRPTS